MPWTDITTFNDEQMMGAYDFKRWIRDNANHLYRDGFPQRATLWHDESLVTAGNALARVINSSYYHLHYMYQNAAANGDQFTQSVCLIEGVYRIYAERVTLSSGGNLVLRLDGIAVAVFGFYSAGTTVTRDAGAAFYVPASKRYTLECTVEGKSASSSGYNIPLTALHFIPVLGDA